MSPIKRTSHAVYDVKYHVVWIPKYRRMVLGGDLAERLKVVFEEIAERYAFEIDTMEVKDDCPFVFECSSGIFSGTGCADYGEYIGQDSI